jgi:hypothetical protein
MERVNMNIDNPYINSDQNVEEAHDAFLQKINNYLETIDFFLMRIYYEIQKFLMMEKQNER